MLGAFRWALGAAVAIAVVVLMLRALVEYVPAVEAVPFVRTILDAWDPLLVRLFQEIGLPWSREIRSLALPAFAIALILGRLMIEDFLRRRTRPRTPVAAAPAPGPAAAASASPIAPPVDQTGSTLLMTGAPAPLPAGVSGTHFGSAPTAIPPPIEQAPKIGRYELVGELGRGAMGVVYKALDPRIGRTVAIKTISAAGTGGELGQYRARFLLEARSAGRLSHPGIVAVHDVTEDDQGRPCLVLEFIEGTTLEKLTARDRDPLPLRKALDIIAQTARALAYAHSNGVIHRDVKPANIMVTHDGRAKLSDFGIAKLDNTNLTVTGQIMGTPAFMSPEQCTGGALDHRSDIFSLGTVLYLLVTGTRPFRGETFTTIAYKVVHDEPVPPHKVNAELPPALDPILAKSLAKAPDDRYASAAQLAEDLEAVIAQLPR